MIVLGFITMATPVDWYDDEHTIIKVTITPTSTWEEYHQTVEWIETEATKVDHLINVIFHDEVGMPKGNPIPHLKKGSEVFFNLPNITTVIIAGSQGVNNAFTRVILTTAARMVVATMPSKTEGRQLLFMASLEEALAYIKQNGSRQDATTRSGRD